MTPHPRQHHQAEPAEPAKTDAIVAGFVALQARNAAEQGRGLRRGTHAKGVCARACFEVLDLAHEHPPALARRLAWGLCARPGVYPARLRFANADPNVNSDWQPDVRSLSLAVDLGVPSRAGALDEPARQDYSMQSAPTLPFNDVAAFVAFAKVAGARNEAVALGAMPWREQLAYAQTQAAISAQQRQPVRPYQALRYWSNVPFAHGPDEIVKYSAWPLAGNPAQALDPANPDALGAELARHLGADATLAGFDFGLQLLDARAMRHQGRQREAGFWIENAAVEWPEAQAPFHRVATIRLLRASASADGAADCQALAFDVTGNALGDSAPLGAINRARRHAELASRRARGQA